MDQLQLGVIELRDGMARICAVSNRQVRNEPEVRIEIRVTSRAKLTEAAALKIAKKYLLQTSRE